MSGPAGQRRILLVTNVRRREAVDVAMKVADALAARGITVVAPEDDISSLDGSGVAPVAADEHAADGCELVVVLGGDGTILRGADLARNSGTPLLGVNLGHVGFLAEAEPDDVEQVVEAVAERLWHVESRMAIDVRILVGGAPVAQTWALNDVSVEKAARDRMLELLVEVDGRPLSQWGCDGVVCATPTGSTAYAFSAGGPVVWPQVEALLLVPISAHALFARPLVVSPSGVLAFELATDAPGDPSAVLWADGRRTFDLPAGARVEVRRARDGVPLARLHDKPFTDRLVAKFSLPTQGWRGRTPGRAGG